MAHHLPRPQKDEFEDVVEPRRREGDVGWILHRQRLPTYRYGVAPLTPEEFKTVTLTSPRVKSEIKRLSETSGQTEAALQHEAQLIMDEMGHALSLRSVRSFGFFIAKVMKRLYNGGVFVNKPGIMKLREAVKDYPVVLLPSHRSYADFLLMSYLCFDYDLPLPVIAAAMDFASMKFFGNLLRRCGAFFIRRSFASDRLYWLLFSEFVRIHLRLGQHPLEFFVEGTRSRTGKSLMPKTGMLGAILESWFLGEVPDVYLVPVSISHDRILEETLYAYELLGIPKPKESTSGLLKARGILSENYGSVHFFVHEPMSLRQLAEGRIDRGLHNLQPRFISGLSAEESRFLKDVAMKVVAKQQSRCVVSPWCLMAVIIAQEPAGISLDLMILRLEFFRDLLLTFGVCVDWRDLSSTKDIIQQQLLIHHQLATLTPDNRIMRVPVEEDVLNEASQCLQLGSYRNQLMHFVVREAILASVLLASANAAKTTCRIEEVKQMFAILFTLLHREFVLDLSLLEENFDTSVANLRKLDSFSIEAGTVNLVTSVTGSVRFLAKILEPFLFGYRQVLTFVSEPGRDAEKVLPEKELAKKVQGVGFQLAEKGQLLFLDALSLDLIGNALASLRSLSRKEGAKQGEIDSKYLSSTHETLNFIFNNVRCDSVTPLARL